MLLSQEVQQTGDKAVSILTRPESRMLRGQCWRCAKAEAVSILTRPESRMLPLARHVLMELEKKVSILTRPESRMLHQCRFLARRFLARFNPHPARKPDATPPETARNVEFQGFNPHPARKPDATCEVSA